MEKPNRNDGPKKRKRNASKSTDDRNGLTEDDLRDINPRIQSILKRGKNNLITEVWEYGEGIWILTSKSTFPGEDEWFEGYAKIFEFEAGPISKKEVRQPLKTMIINGVKIDIKAEQTCKEYLPCKFGELIKKCPRLKNFMK